MNASPRSGLVLAVFPSSRGFGWVLFEGPMALVNWGIASVKTNRSAWCMTRFGRLLDMYRPEAVVLEANEGPKATVPGRVGILLQDMKGFAASRAIDVHAYSRAEVAATLVADESANRSDVARVVADLLPILRDRLPPPRRKWQAIDERRCLFDAAALGITHYRLTRSDS